MQHTSNQERASFSDGASLSDTFMICQEEADRQERRGLHPLIIPGDHGENLNPFTADPSRGQQSNSSKTDTDVDIEGAAGPLHQLHLTSRSIDESCESSTSTAFSSLSRSQSELRASPLRKHRQQLAQTEHTLQSYYANACRGRFSEGFSSAVSTGMVSPRPTSPSTSALSTPPLSARMHSAPVHADFGVPRRAKTMPRLSLDASNDRTVATRALFQRLQSKLDRAQAVATCFCGAQLNKYLHPCCGKSFTVLKGKRKGAVSRWRCTTGARERTKDISMLSSVRGLRRGAGGARSARTAPCPRATNTTDLIVEFGFDDKGEFSKLFEGFAWEAMARGGTPSEVAEEAAETAWDNMSTGGSAEGVEEVSTSDRSLPSADVAVAKAEAQAWIGSWRSKSREEVVEARAAADAKAAKAKAAAAAASNGAAPASAHGAHGTSDVAIAKAEAQAWIGSWRSKCREEVVESGTAVVSNGAATPAAVATAAGTNPEGARAWIAAWRNRSSGSGSSEIVDVGVWPPPMKASTA